MDSLTIYRQAICAVLKDYDFIQSSKPDIETQVLIDRDHDHYQLMRIGWDGSRRVYGTTLHFDIKDGKVWIQHNMTDSDVAAELIDDGVPREDMSTESPTRDVAAIITSLLLRSGHTRLNYNY